MSDQSIPQDVIEHCLNALEPNDYYTPHQVSVVLRAADWLTLRARVAELEAILAQQTKVARALLTDTEARMAALKAALTTISEMDPGVWADVARAALAQESGK